MSRIINPLNPGTLDDETQKEFYPIVSPGQELPHQEWDIFQFQLWYRFHSCTLNTGEGSEGGNIPETEIKWKSISPIHPLCGVNLEKKVLEYKVGDYMLQYVAPICNCLGSLEAQHKKYYSTTLLKTRACYLGSKLLVYINMREKERKAVFISQFCQCQVCNVEWPWERHGFEDVNGVKRVEFDSLSLKPVDMTMRLKNGQEKRIMKLKFLPGVTNQFDMMKDKDDRNFFKVAYYCSVPLSDLPSVPFKDFDKRIGLAPRRVSNGLMCEAESCVESIEVKIGPTSKAYTPTAMECQESEMRGTFKALFEDKEHTDVVLVSKDRKLFDCHKVILSVRSPVFEKIFADRNFEEEQDRGIQLEEGALAVGTLIKYIYFQTTGIKKLSMYDMVGTLKLAYVYGFKEFVAVTSKILLEKMKALEWDDVEGLWELYSFATKEDTVQIIAGLKRLAIIELRRLILAKKNKRARQDDEDATASMNWAFGNNAELAKELAVDLERLLNEDRSQ